jgi:uncharacterized membrane protein
METGMRRACALVLLMPIAACGPVADTPAPPPIPAAPPVEATAPSAATVAPVPPAPAAPKEDLIARGTEPFWAVEIKPTGLKLMRPDHPDQAVPNPGSRTVGTDLVWHTAAFDLELTPSGPDPKAKLCSDGMSDMRYRMYAKIRLKPEDVVMTGCADADDRPTRPGQPGP